METQKYHFVLMWEGCQPNKIDFITPKINYFCIKNQIVLIKLVDFVFGNEWNWVRNFMTCNEVVSYISVSNKIDCVLSTINYIYWQWLGAVELQ